MAEVVNDNDFINFEYFNDYDFNSFTESLDQYLNNESPPFEDRFDPNLVTNPFLPIINSDNNDLNPAKNEWLVSDNNDIHFQINANRCEANDYIQRVNESLVETNATNAFTYGEPNYCDHFHNRSSQQFSCDRFNDNIFHQNSSQIIGNYLIAFNEYL